MVKVKKAIENTLTSRRWVQVTTVLVSTLTVFSCGHHWAWTSPSLPKLYANDSSIPTTREEGSWLASIVAISAVAGPPFGAYGADNYGRRTTILATAIVYLISWIMIGFASHITVLYVARTLAGIADGLAYTVMPIYIAEIAETEIRGKLGSALTMMFDSGILFVYCIGPYITIPAMAALCAVFPIILIFAFFWMPESPYYLLIKKNTSGAKSALQTLRGVDDVDEELQAIGESVEEQMLQSTSWKELFTERSNLKAMMMACGIGSAQALSGIAAFLFYFELIFNQVGSGISASVSAIIFASFQLVGCIVASMLVDSLGRKPLLVCSCIGSAVTLGAQAMYFYLLEFTESDMSSLNWFPMTCMVFYVISFSVGLNTMPFVIAGELFPANVKAKALCFLYLFLSFMYFFVSKFYHAVNEYGTFVPFSVFMAFCILSTFFVIFFIPETKNKSLDEIQTMLKGYENPKIKDEVIDLEKI